MNELKFGSFQNRKHESCEAHVCWKNAFKSVFFGTNMSPIQLIKRVDTRILSSKMTPERIKSSDLFWAVLYRSVPFIIELPTLAFQGFQQLACVAGRHSLLKWTSDNERLKIRSSKCQNSVACSQGSIFCGVTSVHCCQN